MNLDAFHKAVESHAIPESKAVDTEKAMEIIGIVEYSDKTKVSDIDFTQFTEKQCERAMDEIMNYYPDEFGDDGGENAGNLLNEVNRLAHLRQKIGKLKSRNKKRSFF